MSTGGHTANELDKDGYEIDVSVLAGLPMPVWRVDLEVERERPVSAAETTVLALIQAGTVSVGEISRALGMGNDTRLAERVLVRLLGAGAIDALGAGFVVTAIGESWKAAGSAKGRERVSFELRLDPVRDALEWVDHEPAVYGTAETWTIDMTPLDDAEILGRKAQVAALVREEGIPDDEERAPGQRRPPVELRGFAIVGRRIHWREVRLDVWRHPLNGDLQIIGHVGDAENPPLTRLLARYELNAARKRVRHRGQQ